MSSSVLGVRFTYWYTTPFAKAIPWSVTTSLRIENNAGTHSNSSPSGSSNILGMYVFWSVGRVMWKLGGRRLIHIGSRPCIRSSVCEGYENGRWRSFRLAASQRISRVWSVQFVALCPVVGVVRFASAVAWGCFTCDVLPIERKRLSV